MTTYFLQSIENNRQTITIIPVSSTQYAFWLEQQQEHVQQWLKAAAFDPKTGQAILVPGTKGQIECVVLGLEEDQDDYALARAVQVLPAGDYCLGKEAANYPCTAILLFSLAWGLEQYRFSRYKKHTLPLKRLVVPPEVDFILLSAAFSAICLVRDLINTPAQDLTPEFLSKEAEKLAEKHNAHFKTIVGEDLLKEGFPSIYTVGRASVHPPRLIEFNWGDALAPCITLVGKGVCFDTGGLDLKSAQGMRIMKKDMSGAAQVLGLASLIMETNLPVRLRVLIPAVENAVSGNAYHPGDIIKTRKGLTVEVDNTDAEGRVILSDALTYASEASPQLIIDIASLTGASTAALGYDIATLFTNNEITAKELLASADTVKESLWRMPLYAPYKEFICPEIADLANASQVSYGGSITAALFLQTFVGEGIPWIHFDTAAWNERAKPGKPMGGEATVIRSLYDYIACCYAAT